ncbi:MAG: chemotaxis protein CheD [Arcobacteraceae bacterium]|nr:chemotaxis protein CheD [Arcobacteraceae bacterium]
MDKKFIHSGQLHVAARPTYIHTVLGSCVAVCLYDSKSGISGMNHYLLPLWNNDGLQSPKYGNIAIPKLIDAMEAVGCERRNIIAKVFGGASPNDMRHTNENMMIGKRNFQIAVDILAQYNIKMVANDIGGIRGRKIVMDSVSGKIQLTYTQKTTLEQ